MCEEKKRDLEQCRSGGKDEFEEKKMHRVALMIDKTQQVAASVSSPQRTGTICMDQIAALHTSKPSLYTIVPLHRNDLVAQSAMTGLHL